VSRLESGAADVSHQPAVADRARHPRHQSCFTSLGGQAPALEPAGEPVPSKAEEAEIEHQHDYQQQAELDLEPALLLGIGWFVHDRASEVDRLVPQAAS
jgi:hypothetical protein